jgi:signal transduction histidine kinase
MQQSLVAHQEEIKRAEAEIEKESAELEQVLPIAQEVSKRRQIFIQNISRHFNTPLNIIEGLIRVLVDNIAAKEKGKARKSQQEKDINEINATLRYQTNLLVRNTHMLFDSSDIGVADTARYDKTDDVLCNEVVRGCINYVQSLISIEDIKFETELSDDFSIRSNHLYIMRTIRELLYNAAKFSDGQHISVHIEQTETTLRFTVEDVGPGLQENTEELIFIPFTKVDHLSDGLGLGLPLCKRHMVALGGDLIYDSDYKQGCRFIMELPK